MALTMVDVVSCGCFMQSAAHILLVRPVSSAYNPETATSNAFQHPSDVDPMTAVRRAQHEFDAFADGLRKTGVDVIVVDDTDSPAKPDAVFPNNWVTFHADGRVILYPMFAPNRRTERRKDILELLKRRFAIREVIDLSGYEKEGRFLEGTGSMVLDHVHKVAYAGISARTDEGLFLRVCELLSYRPVVFHAFDPNGREIYHTNVMMCIGDGFCIVCLASITDASERSKVEDSLRESGLTIVDITFGQMTHFAGNMLAVKTQTGEPLLVCSRQAAESLTPGQQAALERYARLVPLSIPTIEHLGGGSARCMMAEVFLDERERSPGR